MNMQTNIKQASSLSDLLTKKNMFTIKSIKILTNPMLCWATTKFRKKAKIGIIFGSTTSHCLQSLSGMLRKA